MAAIDLGWWPGGGQRRLGMCRPVSRTQQDPDGATLLCLLRELFRRCRHRRRDMVRDVEIHRARLWFPAEELAAIAGERAIGVAQHRQDAGVGANRYHILRPQPWQ